MLILLKMDISSLCDDILHLIFAMVDNPRCILVCKSWQRTIMLKSHKCSTCNKITKIYNSDLWISDEDDDNDKCHNYCCSIEDFNKLNDVVNNLFSNNQKIRTLKKIIRLINNNEYMTFKIIRNDGQLIQYVHEQTEKLCLEAVKQDGNLLVFFNTNTQNDIICLEAVKQNGLALKYVVIQTEQICMEAVKQNPDARQFIHDKNILLNLGLPMAALAA